MKKTNLPPLEELDLQTKEKLYYNYLKYQTPNFEKYLNYINSVLCILKDYRLISDYTEFSARIKSVESAIKNDGKKALNDVYGIEIHFATPDEESFVLELLRNTIMPTKEVIHNKSNGYIAHHYSGFPVIQNNIAQRLEYVFSNEYSSENLLNEYVLHLPKSKQSEITERKLQQLKRYFKRYVTALQNHISNLNKTIPKKNINMAQYELQHLCTELSNNSSCGIENNEAYFPIIEFQFKTIEVAREAVFGEASHGKYKQENPEEIQAEYDKNGDFPSTRLPIMYKSELEMDENGIPIPPRKLSKEATIKDLYPFILIRRKKLATLQQTNIENSGNQPTIDER